MNDYSNIGLIRLPIPDFELDAAGGGSRLWRLQITGPLSPEAFHLLEEIAKAVSTQAVQCSWQTAGHCLIELIVHSGLHPGSDPVMFITREILTRTIDCLMGEVIELEGTAPDVWRKARFL